MREMQRVIREAVRCLDESIGIETKELYHRGDTIATMGAAGGILRFLAGYLDDLEPGGAPAAAPEGIATVAPSETPKTPNWFALGEAVRARRYELGLAQPDVARRGGPSTQTLMRIENAHRTRYENRTLARLEQALGWKTGSIRAILEGPAVGSVR